MLKTITFSLLAIACAKHTAPAVPNMYDLSGYAGPDYEETNSLCVDGLFANLGNSCDTLVEIQGKGVIKVVQCHKSKTGENPWDKFTFTIHNTHSLSPPPGAMQFCIDPTTVIYIRERP